MVNLGILPSCARPCGAASHRRRGALLLVVLCVLVLFVMIAIAYVRITKQHWSAARASNDAYRRRVEVAARDDLLDEVLLQVVRDTTNSASSLSRHSLLADMYGNDGWKSEIPLANRSLDDLLRPLGLTPASDSPTQTADATVRWPIENATRGQILEFDLLTRTAGHGTHQLAAAASPLNDAYAGQVLTFLNGPARGQSTRIVGSLHPSAAAGNWITLRVMSFALASGATLPANAAELQQTLQGSQILVNGRPFNGTGAGYNPDPTRGADFHGPRLDQEETVPGLTSATLPTPLALMPNAAFVDWSNVPPCNGASYFVASAPDWNGPGGADESYDAPDFQNMAMALVPDAEMVETMLPDLSAPAPTGLGTMVLPSFHRPELLNYWLTKVPDLADKPELVRKVMLRPSWIDHPEFTGSNPEFAAAKATESAADPLKRAIYGPWDVDNDNDGVRDSVWIDFGGPVMVGPNGKLVKPLAAVLCIDLDGRLNVNAHGSSDLAALASPGAAGLTMAGLASAQDTPRGSGYGPADVSLESALGAGVSKLQAGVEADDSPQHAASRDDAGLVTPGRYGFNDRESTTAAATPGRPGLDGASQINMFDWPRRADILSSFGAPPDLWARCSVAVDDFGQPIYEATMADTVSGDSSNNSLLADSPYELDLSDKAPRGVGRVQGHSSADTPFSVAELERVLRVFDADALALPPRLATLGGILAGDPARGDAPDLTRRLRISTDSYDVPTPNVALPDELQGMLSDDPTVRRLPQSVAELLEVRVRAALFRGDASKKFPQPLSSADAAQVRRIVHRLLAPELAAGLRLNINRPLGNGRDDNRPGEPGYGVVDEPGEELVSRARRRIWSDERDASTDEALNQDFEDARFTPLDADGDGAITDADALLQRSLLAQHLYVLALMLTAPPDYDPVPGSSDARLAERLAQWSVNAVDFRDADNILTAFEYDLRPFDGWDVNGWPGDASPGRDGVPGTDDDEPISPGDDAAAFRGLVWGSERPDLLMTESIAWHDRNTTDEDDEAPNGEEKAAASTNLKSEPRGEYDQKFRPRGAFFLELYNPWAANPVAQADVHKLEDGNHKGIALAAVDARTNASPVWRVLVSRDVDDFAQDPDSPQIAKRPAIERAVYFAGFNPADGRNRQWDHAAGVSFYNLPQLPVPPVRPGRYMVVGSGTETSPGSAKFFSPIGQRSDQPDGGLQKPLRGIELNAAANAMPTVRLIGDDNQTAADHTAGGASQTSYLIEAPPENAHLGRIPGDASRCVADVAVINLPRRLTLTEPVAGYPDRFGKSMWMPSLSNPTEEGQYVDEENLAESRPIDTPLDDRDDQLREAGTKANCRRLFLQRLANPLMPYHPQLNPYRTIDEARPNVTVFNGRNPQELGVSNSVALAGFSSVQRGESAVPSMVPNYSANVWGVRSPDSPQRFAADPTRQAGSGNREFYFNAIPSTSLGFLNRSFMVKAEADSLRQRSVPLQPFPWITWNNRPYIGANELMLVPRLGSLQLLNNFSTASGTGGPASDWLPYATTVQDKAPTAVDVGSSTRPRYAHLENFFYEAGDAESADGAPQKLYRLLEFIHSPSLFARTQVWLNPASFTSGRTPSAASDDPRFNHEPPFNVVSAFRDPGRINLNTIFSHAVWQGLFHGDPSPSPTGKTHPGPTWENFQISRHDYAATDTLEFGSLPTFFGNPFRSPDAGDLAPIPEMRNHGVDCTLLRSVAGPASAPLFAAATASNPTAAMDPNEYRDSNRHAYFALQPMTRLGNLVTTRSNVYAIWITIGFFEVQEIQDPKNLAGPHKELVEHMLNRFGDGTLGSARENPMFAKVYPDGYFIGAESREESGEANRRRGFYIVDRTLPVGFESGKSINVGNVIRLRRRLQ